MLPYSATGPQWVTDQNFNVVLYKNSGEEELYNLTFHNQVWKIYQHFDIGI